MGASRDREAVPRSPKAVSSWPAKRRRRGSTGSTRAGRLARWRTGPGVRIPFMVFPRWVTARRDDFITDGCRPRRVTRRAQFTRAAGEDEFIEWLRSGRAARDA